MSDSEDENYDVKGRRQWDPMMEPIMKVIMGKKGIKTKDAAEVGKKFINYFRGKDLYPLLSKREKVLTRKAQTALDKFCGGHAPTEQEEVDRIGTALIEKGFIASAVYQPLPTGPDAKKTYKKWPDRLARDGARRFDPDGYYILIWEGSQTQRYIMLVCVILAILAACLFPAWPLWAKFGAWYLLVGVLSLYFFTEICRVTGFTTMWMVGYEFWILPNLNDEYLGFFDSFKPAYSFERRYDSWLMIGVRMMCLGIGAIAVEQISRTHSVDDVADFVQNSYADLIDWGKHRLENALPQAAEIPKLADIEAEEEAERLEEERQAKLGGGAAGDAAAGDAAGDGGGYKQAAEDVKQAHKGRAKTGSVKQAHVEVDASGDVVDEEDVVEEVD